MGTKVSLAQTAEGVHEQLVSVCGPANNDQLARVSDQSVTPGRLIHKVQPKYPKEARKAHIEGTVALCAVIRRDGKIANLRAFSGPVELTESAIKAVQKWVYAPYLVNGEPVEVETEIRVIFKLD